MTFDQVLPTLVRMCESTEAFSSVDRSCVVRDLHGRVRLVLKPSANFTLDVAGLEGSLSNALGAYFAPPIWLTTTKGDGGRLAEKALEGSEQWDPEYEDPATGERRAVGHGRWRKIERRLSKQVWLEKGTPSPPWPLGGGPAIITFYSFKGGVGRTTALVSCAWQLARAGKRVAVIDLDLEAPGLGAVLESKTERGVLDFIVDFLATASRELSGLHAPAQGLGAGDALAVDVLTAGTLNAAYLEKLARLDFVTAGALEDTEASPVDRALGALLHAVRAERNPDYILIDSRAGLHDLAGLSLHGLAHVDVVVSRASEQAYQGLDLTIRALGLRKSAEDLLCVVVHSLAPMDPTSDAGKRERAEFRERSYQSFTEHIYRDNDVPDINATDASHAPVVVPQDAGLERFSSISAVEPQLFSPAFRALCRRLEELCGAEEDDE